MFRSHRRSVLSVPSSAMYTGMSIDGCSHAMSSNTIQKVLEKQGPDARSQWATDLYSRVFPFRSYLMTTRLPGRVHICTTLMNYADGERDMHAYYGQEKG